MEIIKYNEIGSYKSKDMGDEILKLFIKRWDTKIYCHKNI